MSLNYDAPLYRPPSEARSLIFQVTGTSNFVCKPLNMIVSFGFKVYFLSSKVACISLLNGDVVCFGLRLRAIISHKRNVKQKIIINNNAFFRRGSLDFRAIRNISVVLKTFVYQNNW